MKLKRKTHLWLGTLIIGILMSFTMQALAQNTYLFGLSHGSDLVALDPETGRILGGIQITMEGKFVGGGFGLATHPMTGELWAILLTSTGAIRVLDDEPTETPPTMSLVKLNPGTGVATPVGELNNVFAGLAFNADGKLYGIRYEITGDDTPPPKALYELSTTDGTATLVAALENGGAGEGIAFKDGLLYRYSGCGTDQIFESIMLTEPITITDIPLETQDYCVRAMTYWLSKGVFLASGELLIQLTPDGKVTPIYGADHFPYAGLAFAPADLSSWGIDLRVEARADVNFALVGSDLTYTVTVTNQGVNPATGVRLVYWLSGMTTFVSAPDSCSDQDGFLTCGLGSIDAGASAVVNIVVRPLVEGDLVSWAFVGADEVEKNPEDNFASMETTACIRTKDVTALLGLDAGDDVLWVIDPTTAGTISSINLRSDNGRRISGGNGLAIHPVTGEVWAILRVDDELRSLAKINLESGSVSVVGPTHDYFSALAFDSTGTLYAVTGEGGTIRRAFLSWTLPMRAGPL